jgi:protein-S-isoprenylcysteine O-methyltransferase Ste14
VHPGPGDDLERSTEVVECRRRYGMDLKTLVGSGDRIMLATLPVVVGGVLLNVVFPSFFAVGGPPPVLAGVSIAVSLAGVTIWLWSVGLILRKVPRGELITTGPFALMKHPIYTSVALFVVPWVGFLLNTWIGVAIGVAMCLAARRFAPDEEAELAERFGGAWEDYRGRVLITWL